MKESQKRRYKSVEIVDQCIEKDAQWRSVRFDLDKLNADFNKANKAVALKMKSGEKEEAEKLMPEVKRVDQLRKDTVELEKKLEQETNELLLKIGNIVRARTARRKGTDEILFLDERVLDAVDDHIRAPDAEFAVQNRRARRHVLHVRTDGRDIACENKSSRGQSSIDRCARGVHVSRPRVPARAQTLKPPPRVPRDAPLPLARRSLHAPLVGLRCALSVSTIPPLVTASAAATLTRTPPPHGTTEVYWAGTSNGAAARVVVDVARRALETRRAMREFGAGAARA